MAIGGDITTGTREITTPEGRGVEAHAAGTDASALALGNPFLSHRNALSKVVASVKSAEPRLDLGLIRKVQDGDAGAHRQLFDRYYARVYAFVVRRLSDPQLSEEVVADVFLEVWRSAARFTGKSRFTSWLFGIAQFKCLSASRDRRREKYRQVVPTNVQFLHAVPDEADPIEDLAARDDLRQLMRMIEELSEDQRMVVRMAFLEDMEYEEIARRLGISEGTVKSRVSRARAQLRYGMER